jgi:hypothetical protein
LSRREKLPSRWPTCSPTTLVLAGQFMKSFQRKTRREKRCSACANRHAGPGPSAGRTFSRFRVACLRRSLKKNARSLSPPSAPPTGHMIHRCNAMQSLHAPCLVYCVCPSSMRIGWDPRPTCATQHNAIDLNVQMDEPISLLLACSFYPRFMSSVAHEHALRCRISSSMLDVSSPTD